MLLCLSKNETGDGVEECVRLSPRPVRRSRLCCCGHFFLAWGVGTAPTPRCWGAVGEFRLGRYLVERVLARCVERLSPWWYRKGLSLVFLCAPSQIHLFTWAADIWWDDPEVIVPLLKFTAEFVHNRSQRISFDQSSANGILLFKEVSSILVTYGKRLVRAFGWKEDESFRAAAHPAQTVYVRSAFVTFGMPLVAIYLRQRTDWASSRVQTAKIFERWAFDASSCCSISGATRGSLVGWKKNPSRAIQP